MHMVGKVDTLVGGMTSFSHVSLVLATRTRNLIILSSGHLLLAQSDLIDIKTSPGAKLIFSI